MISWNQNYDIIPLLCMISVTYDIIGLWYHNHSYDIITNIICKIIYDIMESKLWYHTSECMISVTYDIIGLWYHNQYHMQNHIWYHGIKSMISYLLMYDISNLWHHRSMISYMITSMISPMISPMISQSIPKRTQFCKQMISMWAYPIAQESGSWQRRGVELGSGEERKAADWSLEVLDGVCPTPGQRSRLGDRGRAAGSAVWGLPIVIFRRRAARGAWGGGGGGGEGLITKWSCGGGVDGVGEFANAWLCTISSSATLSWYSLDRWSFFCRVPHPLFLRNRQIRSISSGTKICFWHLGAGFVKGICVFSHRNSGSMCK